MKSNVSPLQAHRLDYQPTLPKVLALNPSKIGFKSGKPSRSISDQEAIWKLFPMTYGQPEVMFGPGKS